MNAKRVLVAMSGGVDSSVAALILRDQGYEVVGMTALLFGDTSAAGPCCGREGGDSAQAVCRALGIEHIRVDLTDRFESDVIQRFIHTYQQGRTPNPCSDCNRFIKFDVFFETADELDCRFLATGHHARMTAGADGSPLLRRGMDAGKDQSYFLACIDPGWFARILFPIGEITKPMVRKLADEAGLPTATRDESQDICFLPAGTGIRELMHWHLGMEPKPGRIVDEDGNDLGAHPGIEHFTIGQRKGLRLGGGTEGLVVHRLDPATNTVYVAKHDAHPVTRIRLTGFNNTAPGRWESGAEMLMRARYRQEPWRGRITMDGPEVAIEPQADLYAIALGQWLVGYDNDTVMFGGVIDGIEYR